TITNSNEEPNHLSFYFLMDLLHARGAYRAAALANRYRRRYSLGRGWPRSALRPHRNERPVPVGRIALRRQRRRVVQPGAFARVAYAAHHPQHYPRQPHAAVWHRLRVAAAGEWPVAQPRDRQIHAPQRPAFGGERAGYRR